MAFLTWLGEWLLRLIAPFMLTMDELLEALDASAEEAMPSRTQWDEPQS